MLDTKGPEIRIGSFAENRVMLEPGQLFTLTTEDVVGDETRVSVTYPNLPRDVKPGCVILIDDGLVGMTVEHITDTEVCCKVLNGGAISNRKGVNIPGAHLSMPFISQKDREDILFAIENGFEFIAASFTRSAEDIMQIRHIMAERNCDSISIIAKIENMEGVENLEEILRVADGIMVARGDMGVEIPLEDVPGLQKRIIKDCVRAGKPVITATQMLDSMMKNPRPTRAEATDVANAIYDGTSAIMLSGETAAGDYPVLTLQTMARIAQQTEQDIHYEKRFRKTEFSIHNTVDAISHSVCGMSIDLHAQAIAVCSLSGMTVRMVSRFRSPATILGITTDEKTWRHLALSWGVLPVMCDTFESTDVLFYTAKQLAKRHLKLQSGDTLIITGGIPNGVSGNTNLIKVECI